MNAVEIEEAIYELAQAPFDSAEFPFQVLAAFGNNEVTLKRLRNVGSGGTNLSDVSGAILQRNHKRIQDGSITDYVYDPAQAMLVRRS